jgi:Chalcone isomerase-like
MKRPIAAVLALALTAPAWVGAEEVKEPRSGVSLPTKVGNTSLLGVGLRIRKVAFINAKVYAIGLYASDAAIAGPLAAYKGRTAAPEFYRDLVWGDFEKQVTLKFTRDVDQGRIQEAMRETLAGADKARVDQFVSYFPEVKTGQECVLRWAPGGVLETTMAGQPRPPIADKTFAAAVFAIWLGEKPIQEDIKKDLVSRAPLLIK